MTKTNNTNLTIQIERTSKKWQRAFSRMHIKIEQAAALTFMKAKKPTAFKGRDFDVHILLTTDARIKTMNRDWRGMDKATNVLAFPQLDVPRTRAADLKIYPDTIPLGDVMLAIETIKRECRRDQKTLESHVIHLIVHGVLHLLGYEHRTDQTAKTMEKLECDILGILGYPDPYKIEGQ